MSSSATGVACRLIWRIRAIGCAWHSIGRRIVGCLSVGCLSICLCIRCIIGWSVGLRSMRSLISIGLAAFFRQLSGQTCGACGGLCLCRACSGAIFTTLEFSLVAGTQPLDSLLRASQKWHLIRLSSHQRASGRPKTIYLRVLRVYFTALSMLPLSSCNSWAHASFAEVVTFSEMVTRCLAVKGLATPFASPVLQPLPLVLAIGSRRRLANLCPILP